MGELNHLHRFLDSTFAASFVIYYTFWQIFIFVSLKVILWKVQKLDQKTVQKNTGTWIKNVTCMREIYIFPGSVSFLMIRRVGFGKYPKLFQASLGPVIS